jgi:hypothetical protein|uniref:Uncharacterized protein n=1 Tax=viral metagenome TaxID=1070528 RepID=A0A6C0JGZ0_9ZZZZ
MSSPDELEERKAYTREWVYMVLHIALWVVFVCMFLAFFKLVNER